MSPNVIVIEGIYYDADKLAAIHPGGEIFVAQSANRDGTALYNSSHRKRFSHDKYKHLVLKGVTSYPGLEENKQDFSLYFEICQKVKPLLKERNGFAPNYFYAKAAFLILSAMVVDFLIFSGGRTFGLSVIQGLLFALIGLGIQHDANHGSISKNPAINRAVGMAQDYIGGSALSWMINHNTDHHIFCNDIERDCDLQMPVMRLTPLVEWKAHHQVQQFFLSALQMMFGPVHIFQAFLFSAAGANKDQKAMEPFFQTQRLAMIVNILRLGLGFYLEPNWTFLFNFFCIYAFGGFYLAFFFFVSHNYDGVNKTVNAIEGCFVKHQVETSSNVCGWWLAQINGGLNYQIEHHLFPRVHSSNYHWISPIVREHCEKHGIRYTHFSTLAENSKSVFRHLEILGQKPQAAKKTQ